MAPERRRDGDGHGEADIGGFDFQLANVDNIAPRMEELAAQAAIQHMPAAEFLAEALESEAICLLRNVPPKILHTSSGHLP